MAILGITNRTENWKTACYFAPLFGHGSVRVARRLLATEAEGAKLHPGDVSLELFWKGMRDHFDQRRKNRTQTQKDRTAERALLTQEYSRLFPDLRQRVMAFEGSGEPQDLRFRDLQDGNYSVSTPARRKRLVSNLLNTEVDIVLESPSHLFIGEAKHLSDLGADSRHVLTHQLVRQYVMARILVELRGTEHTVVPFVVSDGGTDVENSSQVQFMLEQCYLREANILQWSDIEALW